MPNIMYILDSPDTNIYRIYESFDDAVSDMNKDIKAVLLGFARKIYNDETSDKYADMIMAEFAKSGYVYDKHTCISLMKYGYYGYNDCTISISIFWAQDRSGNTWIIRTVPVITHK